MKKIEIYTDGACRGNPGPGGWGAVIYSEGEPVRYLQGAFEMTTNNRMELTAAIEALAALGIAAAQIQIFTDSRYVQQGIQSWLLRWKKNAWRTADRKPVKNQDLWQRLDQLCLQYNPQWFWVKGHSGHPDNEKADQLANQAIDTLIHADN